MSGLGHSNQENITHNCTYRGIHFRGIREGLIAHGHWIYFLVRVTLGLVRVRIMAKVRVKVRFRVQKDLGFDP